ncbi:HD-GYP domain-containing protein [Paenibacillus sp. N3.4]|uniref:HD-GYP domain-containing protein n=1 Tax=Paenibacillus sp. N3.4 TaxID=2603222 RepID=UPI0011C96DB0|nr:HD-GYP domain-containing protein [Paenibacillus sp. N3.4]TXK77840.1 HD-GYP domain-containing protein [Paenibacillus sp. N3.4]
MSFDGLLGKRVKHDITNAVGNVLLPAGFVIEQEHIKLLEQHRVNASEVIVMMGDYRSEVHHAQLTLISDAANYSKDLFNRLGGTKKMPLLEIKNELIPIIQEASEYPDVFQLFEAVSAKDEYTHQHNIGVGVLSTLLGKWMGLGQTEITLLTLAATLHDVGKVRISSEILLKPGKLTDEEFAEMRRHTLYGYEILKNTVGLSPRVAQVALQHHERSDGRGYPLRLKEEQIDPLSKIVAVADVFHAMSSKRPYHEALPFHEVIEQMRRGAFGELDPHVSATFLNKMIQHLVGRRVKLTDGQWGEVVFINPHDDLHPLVKISESFIDLSEERQLHIQEVIV